MSEAEWEMDLFAIAFAGAEITARGGVFFYSESGSVMRRLALYLLHLFDSRVKLGAWSAVSTIALGSDILPFSVIAK